MNRHTAMKIAVSVPAKTLEGVELARKRLGRTRSSVVAEALEAWLRARGQGEEDRRYLEGYARCPEPDEGAVAAAVMESWDAWEEPSSAKRRRRARASR